MAWESEVKTATSPWAARGATVSANCGWISLSDAFEFVQTHTITPGVDPDDDRIADAWESQHFGNLTAASVTSNADGDPATDLQQYLADTHPTHATRYLGITDYASTGTTNALMWTKCIDAALSC